MNRPVLTITNTFYRTVAMERDGLWSGVSLPAEGVDDTQTPDLLYPPGYYGLARHLSIWNEAHNLNDEWNPTHQKAKAYEPLETSIQQPMEYRSLDEGLWYWSPPAIPDEDSPASLEYGFPGTAHALSIWNEAHNLDHDFDLRKAVQADVRTMMSATTLEPNPPKIEQITDGADPRLRQFWINAAREATARGHCDEYDDMVEVLNGPSRSELGDELNVDVEITVTIPARTITLTVKSDISADQLQVVDVLHLLEAQHDDLDDHLPLQVWSDLVNTGNGRVDWEGSTCSPS